MVAIAFRLWGMVRLDVRDPETGEATLESQ